MNYPGNHTMGHSKRRFVVQRHHLEYQPGLDFKDKVGEVVRIYQSEHWVITQLQRRKIVSTGLLRSLKHWINQVEKELIEVDLHDLESG